MSLTLQQLHSCDAIICSDIHIREQDDEKAKTLVTLLEQIIESPPKHLFLLGDIFDFCLGRQKYFHEKFSQIGSLLTELAKGPTKVTFFEGNHEFDASDLPWEGVEFIFEGDHVYELDSGTRILLAHGDLVYSHRMYKAFRSIVKTRLVKSVASLLPGEWMDRFALGNADLSRSADQYRELDHADVQKVMTNWAESYPCDHAVFGHLHYPYGFQKNDGGWVASCGSWYDPTILAISGSEMLRSVFKLPNEQFIFKRIEENNGPKKKQITSSSQNKEKN